MTTEDKINKAVSKINSKGYTVFYVRNRDPEPAYSAPDVWGVNGHEPVFVSTTSQGDVPVDTGEHSVLGIDYLFQWDYVIKCEEGHKQTIKHGNVSLIDECPFCEGKRHTSKQVRTLLAESDMDNIELTTSVDSSNNEVVLQKYKVAYTCPQGHKTREALQHTLNKVVDGKVQCTLCSDKSYNYPESRSESIIDYTLRHNGIDFDREVPVSNSLRSLKFDFMIHELEVIIEYDGEHHRYGSHGGKNLEVYKRNDKVKDRIAKELGYKMIRIPHNVQGMRIVWFLKEHLLPDINIFEPAYKKHVVDIYNRTHELYGWEPMSTYQDRADTYVALRKTKAVEQTGLSASVLQRAYDIAYGIPLSEYRDTEHYLTKGVDLA